MPLKPFGGDVIVSTRVRRSAFGRDPYSRSLVEIIPAIDLREGRVVRLVQGDFDRETIFDRDPEIVARRWMDAGARRIHVVDLDAARGASRDNRSILSRLARIPGACLQVGGGVRSLDRARELIDLGVDRIVFGTLAVREPQTVAEAARLWSERVIVGIDARDGHVATDGWIATSSTLALDLARRLVSDGVRRLFYTDIARDGALDGPNIAAVAELVRQVPVPVIASGGVTGLEDLDRLGATGVEGVIVGRALYEGRFELADALARAATV